MTSAPVGKQPLALGTVQETLLVPLYARAIESQRRRGLLDDPKAVALCDALDYDFRRARSNRQTQLGCVLRTMQFDAWVTDHLARHPTGTVVEIGAGLNTRFERTDNGTARFVEIDLPDAMAVRRRFFEDGPRRVGIAGNLLENDWFDAVDPGRQTARGGSAAVGYADTLLLIEGVLTYLTETQVRGAFARLAARFPGAMLAFDALTPRGVATQQRRAMRELAAEFVWGVASIREIETWGDGFTCLDAVNMRHVILRNRHRIPATALLIAGLMATVSRGKVEDYWMALYRLGDGVTEESA